MYRELWSPLLAELGSMGIAPGAELVWFHQGGSAVLPMHAAWRTDDGTRRWLLDDHAIRYATSVRALLRRSLRTEAVGPTAIVANPTGNLAYAELENVWVKGAVAPEPVIELRGDGATRAAVMAAFAACRVAHFATHASFDWRDPFGSAVTLANGESLTLADLIPLLRGRSPELVVLSACETGVTRVTSTPDELLGFPTAFLELGTTDVVSTLWPVDDAAAGLVTSRFHQECARGTVRRAEALRRAQLWVRDLTVRELLATLRDARDLPPPAGPLAASAAARLRARNPEDRPFFDPGFWAAFSLTGA
jgi:CHAT domain-containing protein